MQLYLVRHGETQWNNERKIQGGADIPLNETGREQARGLYEQFRELCPDVVYSSPLGRAFETAQLATGWDAGRILRDERLRELSFGPHEGDYLDDLEPEFGKVFWQPEEYVAVDGAESLEALLERTGAFLGEIARRHRGQKVVVFCHGGVIRAMLLQIQGLGLEDFWNMEQRVGNCSLFPVMLGEDGQLSLDLQ